MAKILNQNQRPSYVKYTNNVVKTKRIIALIRFAETESQGVRRFWGESDS